MLLDPVDTLGQHTRFAVRIRLQDLPYLSLPEITNSVPLWTFIYNTSGASEAKSYAKPLLPQPTGRAGCRAECRGLMITAAFSSNDAVGTSSVHLTVHHGLDDIPRPTLPGMASFTVAAMTSPMRRSVATNNARMLGSLAPVLSATFSLHC